MEKNFSVSNYPLEQTEFLYDAKQGTDWIIYWKYVGSEADDSERK